MLPERMPKSLLVVGRARSGSGFASFYRNFGAEVTVVEILPPDTAGGRRGRFRRFARKQFENKASRS